MYPANEIRWATCSVVASLGFSWLVPRLRWCLRSGNLVVVTILSYSAISLGWSGLASAPGLVEPCIFTPSATAAVHERKTRLAKLLGRGRIGPALVPRFSGIVGRATVFRQACKLESGACACRSGVR